MHTKIDGARIDMPLLLAQPTKIEHSKINLTKLVNMLIEISLQRQGQPHLNATMIRNTDTVKTAV